MDFGSIYSFSSNKLSDIERHFKGGEEESTRNNTSLKQSSLNDTSIEQSSSCQTSLLQVLTSRNINDPSTVELVLATLSNGADVNARGRKNETPLMVAAYKEDCENMLQILLDHGANLCGQDIMGRTALFYAFGNDRNVSFLLQFSQNCDFVNLCDAYGYTALNRAVCEGRIGLVSEIIDRGVDVDRHYRDYNTPLLTLLYKHIEPSLLILTTLLNAGSDVTFQNEVGISPLMMAASRYTVRPFSAQLRSRDIVRVNVLIKGVHFHVIRAASDFFCDIHPAQHLLENGRENYKNSYEVYQNLLTVRPNFERTIKTLLEAGVDVNAVSKKDSTKTALSFLPSVTYRGEVTIFCMDAFLERFAKSTTVNPVVLQEVILHGAIDVIPKLIQCGLLPAEIKANRFELDINEPDDPNLVSPLCLALLTGNVSLAHYFMGNFFLTSSDVTKLSSGRTIRNILVRKNHQECLNFFDEMAAQPMSLFKQAFVAVSSAVGTSPGRANRVEQLPIPRGLKNCLLFNREQVKLSTSSRV